MKILVTGATGFIGNHVVRELLNNNHEVVATSLRKEKAEVADWFKDVKYFQLDLHRCHNINCVKYFGNPGAIIHLAWQGLPNFKSLYHFEYNLYSHYIFLKNIVTNGVTDITVTGTCLEYGMREGCLDETMPALPTTAYGLAKDCLRRFMEELLKVNPFLFKWVRLFYMYGKGQNEQSLIPQLEKVLQANGEVFNMSAGEQKRDYLTVEMVAENIVKIATQINVTGVINCCSGCPVTVKQVVEKYLRENKKEIQLNLGYYPYTDYEPFEFWGYYRKLHSIIK